jgi:RND family efflux transporter MFP subunit
VVAEVDEEDIPRVVVGQPVLIAADGFPGRTLSGKVDRITPKGDPVNKNYRVRVLLPDDTPLLIGMTVETNIVVRRIEDAVLAPVDAVVDGRVWVVEDGRVRARTVETGIRGRDRFQILNGLRPEEIVVVAPPEGLKEGARVRWRPASTGT